MADIEGLGSHDPEFQRKRDELDQLLRAVDRLIIELKDDFSFMDLGLLKDDLELRVITVEMILELRKRRRPPKPSS